MISCLVLDNVCIYCIIYILLIIIIINATVAIVTESWPTDSVPSTAISIGQSFNVSQRQTYARRRFVGLCSQLYSNYTPREYRSQ